MHPDAESIIISEEEIKKRVRELGEQISADYAGREILVVSVLKGSVLFMADLIRNITVPTRIDFVLLSSYGSGTESSGNVVIEKDLQESVKDRDVLVVEDIVDTGHTLAFLKQYLLDKGCKSIRVCVLTNKPARRVTEVDIDYKGFEIPDKYVAGYGMDYNNQYRNIPYIFAVKPEVYNEQ